MSLKFAVVLLFPLWANAETVTAYCDGNGKGCVKCCGPNSPKPAANGKMPIEGVTVAGPRRYPLGTKVMIEGLGERIIQDRLAKRFDDRFDVYFSNHQAALKFGRRNLKVTIYGKND